MTAFLAEAVFDRATTELRELFAGNPCLVPAPSSFLLLKGALWVPLNLARALVNVGLGGQVRPLLRRQSP